MLTTDQITSLHKKFAPSKEIFQSVYTHCTIVWEIAQELLLSYSSNIDIDLVKAGCMIHDLGVYKLFNADSTPKNDSYILHGVLGYEVLKKEGFNEAVCRFASCHTGVGLTQHDITAQSLPLPPGDYTAQTNEERLVMYADKFHSKTSPPVFNTAEWYANYVERFGLDKRDMFEQMVKEFGKPNIEKLAHKYNQSIRS